MVAHGDSDVPVGGDVQRADLHVERVPPEYQLGEDGDAVSRLDDGQDRVVVPRLEADVGLEAVLLQELAGVRPGLLLDEDEVFPAKFLDRDDVELRQRMSLGEDSHQRVA